MAIDLTQSDSEFAMDPSGSMTPAGQAQEESRHSGSDVDAPSDSSDAPSVGPPRKRRRRAKKSVVKDSDEHAVMKSYNDLPVPPPKGPGGRTADPLLDKVSVYTRHIAKPDTPIWRCHGAMKGCRKNFPNPRSSARVFKHAELCNYLPSAIRREVTERLAEKDVGTKIKTGNKGMNVVLP